MRLAEFLIFALLGVDHATPSPTTVSHNPALHPLLIDLTSHAGSLPRAPLDRLPRNVVPTHYALRFHPILDVDPADATASGHVAINVTTLLPDTNSITLHLNEDLVLVDQDNARLVALSSGDDMGPLFFSYDPAKEFYTVQLDTEGATLAQGASYLLELPFTTRMAGEPFGFWVAAARDPVHPDDDLRMCATILEPNFARRVLPCFDEPDLKAEFEITIGRGGGHQALTHTELVDTDEIDGVFWDKFAKTPLMSAYQLCLVVVPSHYSATVDSTDTFPDAPVGAWGPGHLIEAGGGLLAANTIAKSLAYFQATYGADGVDDADKGTPYSLKKMDSIVIPGFPAGALENWGINTYREASLMLFAGESLQATIGGAVSTQNHEVSHQWFGNLVTCRWWDDIWLNEGLANYMSFKGVAATNPEFEPGTLFVPDSLQVAMRRDQNHATTHPVRFPALPENWMDIFDTISYAKGGSLLRMLEGVLGEPLFIAGMREYLRTWNFGAADQDDLFEAIDRAVDAAAARPFPPGMTVKTFMQRWTLQAGYPLLQVSRASASIVFLSQERFGAAGGAVPNAFWDVPVKIARAGGGDENGRTAPDVWLTATTSLTSYSGLNTSRWVLANAGAYGYYRVLYDEPLFNLILDQLESGEGGHEEISAGSRSQLHDDYWELEVAGYAPLDAPLALTRYLASESHLAVWSPVLDHLAEYRSRLSGTPGEAQFARYMLPRLEGALGLIGWDQLQMVDNGTEVILRAGLLDWACGFGSEQCGTQAVNYFGTYELSSPDQINNLIPIDIQATMLCGAVASPTRGADAHALFLQQYNAPNTPEAVRQRLLQPLACAKEPALLTATLTAALNSNLIRPVDKVALLQRVVTVNAAGRGATFDAACVAVVGGGEGADPPTLTPQEFAAVVGTLAGFWYTDEEADALQAFVVAHESLLAPVRGTLDDHLARVATNGVWMETRGKPLVEWMLGEARSSTSRRQIKMSHDL